MRRVVPQHHPAKDFAPELYRGPKTENMEDIIIGGLTREVGRLLKEGRRLPQHRAIDQYPGFLRREYRVHDRIVCLRHVGSPRKDEGARLFEVEKGRRHKHGMRRKQASGAWMTYNLETFDATVVPKAKISTKG